MLELLLVDSIIEEAIFAYSAEADDETWGILINEDMLSFIETKQLEEVMDLATTSVVTDMGLPCTNSGK